jgi:catechol 2,3-dioxygenase-like lactoylglutathione lyase family enzyme
MKRLHVHVPVSDLAQGIRFYATLCGADRAAEAAPRCATPARERECAAAGRVRAPLLHVAFAANRPDRLSAPS